MQPSPGADSQALARKTLEELCGYAVSGFPHQILPNKLLREIEAMAKSADLKVPFVDELAADIFLIAFGEKFLRSAQTAARLLRGRLYERYYGIDYAEVGQIDDLAPAWAEGPSTSKRFYNLCLARAGIATSGNVVPSGSYVARNGTIIEQEQILTTHNLAVIYAHIGGNRMPDGVDLAKACFQWVCRRLQQMPPKYQLKLRVVKNSAYAWRQMIFFLSLTPASTVGEFMTWAREHFAAQPEAFRTRFAPAVEGLSRAIDGGDIDDGEVSRRFLGWATGGHWLLKETKSE